MPLSMPSSIYVHLRRPFLEAYRFCSLFHPHLKTIGTEIIITYCRSSKNTVIVGKIKSLKLDL